MDSTIDRLFDKNSALKATLRQSLQALKLVKVAHDSPDFFPIMQVKLDRKAYEQVAHAITNAEEVLS